jgi:hypothetical protein
VVFKEGNSREFKVGAVVSSYRIQQEETIFENQKTPIKVLGNSGIMIAYDIIRVWRDGTYTSEEYVVLKVHNVANPAIQHKLSRYVI